MAHFTNSVGTLTATETVLYTAPSGSNGAIVISGTFSNKTTGVGASTHQVTLKLNDVANSKSAIVLPATDIVPNGGEALKPEMQLVLKPNDTVSGFADAGSVIDFVLGITEM
jgi:hypothetical protein